MIRTGKWLGRSGGGLDLTLANGIVTGRYQTKVGRPDPNAWFDVTGFSDGQLIGFVVLWNADDPQQNSLTSWTGRYVSDGDGERIEAIWHLCRLSKYGTKQTETGPPEAVLLQTQLWESFLTHYAKLYYTP